MDVEQGELGERDTPRRIVWLVRGDEGYGVRRAVVSLVQAVARRGHRAMVLCLERGEVGQACAARGAAVRMLELEPLPPLAGSWRAKARAWRKLRGYERRATPQVAAAVRELADGPVDVVHVLWPNMLGLGAAVARRMGAACVWEMPNVIGTTTSAALSRAFYQWRCWRGNAWVLANSAYTAKSLGGALVRPRVMHLGADAQRFDPARVTPITRSALNIPDDAAVLGVVARVEASKGQDRVLAAMLELLREDPATHNLHLLLLGGPIEDAYAQSLRRAANEAAAADRLHLVGPVLDPERYYPVMDVAINARVDAEPFGLTVVEAMMMGKPAAVHARGGPAETVIDARTGWHVHQSSVACWAAALRRVLADRPRWAEMGAAARKHALAHFTLERQAALYLQVVEQAVRARGSKQRDA